VEIKQRKTKLRNNKTTAIENSCSEGLKCGGLKLLEKILIYFTKIHDTETNICRLKRRKRTPILKKGG
jgi:hypothetical protein